MKIQLNLPKCSVPVWEHEQDKSLKMTGKRVWYNLAQNHTLSYWEGNDYWMLMTGLVTVSISPKEALDILKSHRPVEIEVFPRGDKYRPYPPGTDLECIGCKSKATIAKRFCQDCYNEFAGIERCEECNKAKCICHANDMNCGTCAGTGIGQHGDPDTSKCTACGGKGYFKDEPECEPDYYREMKDAEYERDFQEAIEE